MSNSISFVIPCLNEEQTLPQVLRVIQDAITRDFSDRDTEILVTDNGSTDRSVEIATSLGARVVSCERKGYGANLLNGFTNAAHDIIIFADADGSYNFAESHKLVRQLERGYDMVVGSRYKGSIAKGAMPPLHRYLGTPVLNMLINLLYSKMGNYISDCNSGFRCFYKNALNLSLLRSSGMEFASEIIILALQHKLRISEVPISLAPDGRERAPSLQTWKDGMRHLLCILSRAPQLFFWTGITIWIASNAIIAVTALKGVTAIGAVRVFGIHTALIATAGSVAGLQIWNVGMFTSTFIRHSISSGMYHRLKHIAENKLFLILCIFITYTVASGVWVLYRWSINDYQFLTVEADLVLLVSLFITFAHIIASMIAVRLIPHEA